MAEYGVTDKGFNIKRLDTIMEEIHTDLTEGFGFDTRLTKPSFLDSLITTFAYQISDLWEVAQDSYYAKYPATATGVNLDNAVQYGGVRRAAKKQTTYQLHCTGDDGTYVKEEVIVSTDTSPEIRLKSANEFRITRESCNRAKIQVASVEIGTYTITINGESYSYQSTDGNEENIIAGLRAAIDTDEYTISATGNVLTIEDKTLGRSNVLALSDNLTTASVTVIVPFLTEDYGKITIPVGMVKKIVNNITGFNAVTNLLNPVYGRNRESDIELRQSYIAKSALRSSTMIESIVGELLNNIDGVESASGYENSNDTTDERGLPPHSIEIIVEGGDPNDIAAAILRKKAGGIQTYGNTEVSVAGIYGDTIPVCFNRPEYLYVWIKIVLYGSKDEAPLNYKNLAISSVMNDASGIRSGDPFLTQLFIGGLYGNISSLVHADVLVAYSPNKSYRPESGDYLSTNIIATSRQKILISEDHIDVSWQEYTGARRGG